MTANDVPGPLRRLASTLTRPISWAVVGVAVVDGPRMMVTGARVVGASLVSQSVAVPGWEKG